MAFVRSRRWSSPRGFPRTARVWAIGSRAYVHGAGPSGAVVLTDEFARVASMAVDDGAAVEVCAWRPGGAAGARYHVRTVDRAAEGWLGAEDLRATPEPPAVPAAHMADPDAPAPPPRFGGR